MFLIQVRILLSFQEVVLHRQAVQVLLLGEDRVEGVDNILHIHLSRRYSHGNFLEMPRESAPSSTQYGQKKVRGGYGKVVPHEEWSVDAGSNSTFVYSMLFESMETWLSSLLAATFALPDPTLFDMLDSPTPGLSLAAALTATAITALVLAPLDLYRITSAPLLVKTDI